MSNRPTTVARRRELYEEAAEIIEREYERELELENVAAASPPRAASSSARSPRPAGRASAIT